MFDALAQKILPDLIRSKSASGASKRIRIWSAACSTGQEAYSLGMMLSECIPDIHGAWDVHLFGSDISDDAVSRASKGWYAGHETARGLSPQRLTRFFRPIQNGFQVADELRALMSFERRNLLAPFSFAGRFDIIFCRNVAIYFTPAARADLFQRLAASLTPGGILFVGAQESLGDLGPRFAQETVGRAAYYRPTFQHA
jgi:chemotaxis protein methyltransferase CheR